MAPEKTRAEIEATLQRYQATQFLSGWDGDTAFIGFRLRDRVIRFTLHLPSRAEKQFTTRPRRGYRVNATPQQAIAAWEQAVRQRWRALLLCIKAKLEAVVAGIESFDSAFLAYFVLGTGQTLGEAIRPQLDQAFRTGELPPLLPALPPPAKE